MKGGEYPYFLFQSHLFYFYFKNNCLLLFYYVLFLSEYYDIRRCTYCQQVSNQ